MGWLLVWVVGSASGRSFMCRVVLLLLCVGCFFCGVVLLVVCSWWFFGYLSIPGWLFLVLVFGMLWWGGLGLFAACRVGVSFVGVLVIGVC